MVQTCIGIIPAGTLYLTLTVSGPEASELEAVPHIPCNFLAKSA